MYHPQIPLDVIELVIAIVGAENDMVSLRALALVSSLLLWSARSHLFRTINLDPFDGCPIFAARNYDSLDRLLHNVPSIRLHIRDLSISRLGFMAHGDPDPRTCHQCRREHLVTGRALRQCVLDKTRLLPSILSQLSRLTNFVVNYAHAESHILLWYQLSPVTASALSNYLRRTSVTSLSLSLCMEVPASVIASILQLSQLTFLKLDSVKVDEGSDLSSLLTLERSTLCNLQEFYFVPDQLVSRSAIQYSILVGVGNLVLQAAYQSLRTFKCYVYNHRDLSCVAVGALRNLKVLSLLFDFVPYAIGMKPILSQIAAAHENRASIEIIELICIDVTPLDEFVEKTEKKEMKHFDDILQQPAFSRLNEIRVAQKYPWYEETPDMYIAIKRMLPRTFERAVISVTQIELYPRLDVLVHSPSCPGAPVSKSFDYLDTQSWSE